MSEPKGIEPGDFRVFMLDDGRSLPQKRSTISDIIDKATDDGARAIVLDLYFASDVETEQNQRLRESVANAITRGIPVFSVLPENKLQEDLLADVDGLVSGGMRLYTRVPIHLIPFTYLGFRSLADFALSYNNLVDTESQSGEEVAIPALLADTLTECEDKKSFTEVDNLIGQLRFSDLDLRESPTPTSYLDYDIVPMGDSIVVISIEAYLSHNDDSELWPRVFDVISASIAYSQAMCPAED